MHELTIDDIEQVGGGLNYYYYTYPGGVFIVIGGEVMQPSPGPVIPEMA